MIDVGAIRRDCRHDDIFDLIKAGVVNLRCILTCLGPIAQMRQLGRQDRRLHAVESAVDTFDTMLMLDKAAVARQHGHMLGQRAVVGDNGAGIAHRAEILAGIKRIG